MIDLILLSLCSVSAFFWFVLLYMPVRWRMSERWEACEDSYASHSQLPRLSVIVPARNESDSLPLTLPSWLDQDYPESGIILIDLNQLTVLKNALIAFPHAAVIPSALS